MSNAVAKKPDVAPEVISETTAIIQMIERVALNPQADITKLERIMEMRERVMAQNAKRAYTDALAAMQPELPITPERGAIKVDNKVRSTYALWEDVNELIKPVLANHGFALAFRTTQDDKSISVTGSLSHRDGHSEETTMRLPIDTSGSKNAVQAIGSSVSYGKRYTAAALLNLTSRNEDDDAVGTTEFITEDQLGELTALIESVGADKAKFLKYLKLDKLGDIPAKEFKNAVDALNAKRKA